MHAKGASPAALDTVALEGAVAEIAFPRGMTVAAWASKLLADGTFPGQEDHLSRVTGAAAVSHPSDLASDVRPCVGIVVNQPEDLFPHPENGVAAIVALAKQMGLRPVLIPPCADALAPKRRGAIIAGLLEPLDALIGPGGPDIDPRIYHAKNLYSVHTNYARDLFEKALVLAAMDRPLFMFGICRSHQLWNAAKGGDLAQDLRKQGLATRSHRRRPRGAALLDHLVNLERMSRARALAGADSIPTNALHHQAVLHTGRGIVASGFVHDPGTHKDIIEVTEAWNMITTQFHPELMAEGTEARALFSVVGRRAHIFRLMRRLGSDRTLAKLEEAMRASAQFQELDYAWVREELAPRFLRS